MNIHKLRSIIGITVNQYLELRVENSMDKSYKVIRSTGIVADMSNLTVQELVAEIEQTDSKMVPFSKFMERSLYGRHGYYSSGRVEIGKGESKDFFTAAEDSFFFGATIGEQATRLWEQMGRPKGFTIVEMGAGEGGMAESILEYLKVTSPDFFKLVQYNILDLGRELIPRQQKRLGQTGKKVSWVHGSATELPFTNVSGMFISNELPDAFPIEVVTQRDGIVGQVYIGLDDNKEWIEYLVPLSPEVDNYIQDNGITLVDGDSFPVNLLAEKFQRNLCKAMDRGAILTIDYGGTKAEDMGHSVQYYAKGVIRDNKSVQKQDWKYAFPGQVDITARINFKALEDITQSEGLQTIFGGSQAEILEAMGINQVAAKVSNAFKQSNWRIIERVSKDFDHFWEFKSRCKSFYGHLLTKNLEGLDVLPPKKDIDQKNLEMKISIPVSKLSPGELVRIDYKDSTGEQTMVVEVEGDRTISVKPCLLRGSKISLRDNPQRVLYDLSEDSNLYSLLDVVGIAHN